MEQLRCGVRTDAKWKVGITGDAVDMDPDNVATVPAGDPFGLAVKVWDVVVVWHLDPRGLVPWSPDLLWSWNPEPSVTLWRSYVDADGHYTDPDPNGPGMSSETIDWSSHTAPAWVRRLVEERAVGPTGERAKLPLPPAPPTQVCAHSECPAHGGGDA